MQTGTGAGVGSSAGTVAGTGTSGFSGDGGPAIAAQIGYPEAITADKTGNVYFDDSGRLRKIAVNGLYRHGFLLAPALAELTLGYVARGAIDNEVMRCA